MAKLLGPLHSDGASGKIANAMVFFPWKGLSVVRRYIIPHNPKSTDQTTVRKAMSVCGHGAKWAQATAMKAPSQTLKDKDRIKALNLPAHIPWNAYLVQKAIGTLEVYYLAASAAWTAIGAPAQADWDDAADALTPAIQAYGTATSGEVFFHYVYALYIMGLSAIPGATPPTYT